MEKKRILEQILEKVGTIKIDEDNTIQFADTLFSNIIGYNPEELIGKKISEIMSKKEFEEYKLLVNNIKENKPIVRDKPSISYKTKIKYKDNRVVPIDINMVIVPTITEGTYDGMIALVTKTEQILIPACSKCNSIRIDDKRGIWLRPSDERYTQHLEDKTKTTFSHGICSNCYKELYPEQYQRRKKQQQKP